AEEEGGGTCHGLRVRWHGRLSRFDSTTRHSEQPAIVTRPPAAATPSAAIPLSKTGSTQGFLPGSSPPAAASGSIVHWVRCGSNPSLTDQMQALVSVSNAYSTASRDFSVFATMIGSTFSLSRYMVRLASTIAATKSTTKARSLAITSVAIP